MDFIDALRDAEFRAFVDRESKKIDDDIAKALLDTIDFKETP